MLNIFVKYMWLCMHLCGYGSLYACVSEVTLLQLCKISHKICYVVRLYSITVCAISSHELATIRWVNIVLQNILISNQSSQSEAMSEAMFDGAEIFGPSFELFAFLKRIPSPLNENTCSFLWKRNKCLMILWKWPRKWQNHVPIHQFHK